MNFKLTTIELDKTVEEKFLQTKLSIEQIYMFTSINH